jgi:hypothetical protein
MIRTPSIMFPERKNSNRNLERCGEAAKRLTRVVSVMLATPPVREREL